jgi:large subunit ribosomal protein L18
MKARSKEENRIKRHKRIRARISGTAERPRLVVFRSNKHVYAQLVNDDTGRTMVAVSDLKIKEKAKGVELAKVLATQLAKAAKEQKIERLVFDRRGYAYHGTIKVFADQVRAEGISL